MLGSNCFGGWAYNSVVTINSDNVNALTDYQVKVVINTQALIAEGKMNADGSDIRFGDENCTELSYWIASGINTATTVVWVKVPNVTAGSTEVNLFYGKADASAASNGASTFLYFDDFNDGNHN